MRHGPDFLRDRRGQYRRFMDVLSDVIAVTRTGEPRSARVVWHAPWAQRFGSVPGASGFQVVLHGTCWLVTPDADPVHLGAGDVVFLPHGQGHVLTNDPTTPVSTQACDPNDPQFAQRHAAATVDPHGNGGPATVTLCGAYQLDPRRAHPLLNDLPETIHLPARPAQHPDLSAAVRLLGAELERPRLGTDAVIPALLDTLLLYILRTWFDEQPPHAATRWFAALNDRAITCALHAIHQAPAQPWTVAALAAEAGLSRAPFARRFTALVGQPALGYLTWWRMTIAARLLRDTDAPLSTIATKVGYASEFAFATAFKRTQGISPGGYRRTGDT